ncbi:phospholipase D-like domain-containing protein [Bordetella genomosp. 12]|uniref:Cardiolipin synthase B n=1 Tax=Bordetella genomosp. 12 TaxID=463035 RepID=A0A261VLF7_9BORD|nr:phospholipase D-like domain-containing protein [Bordetella genomosp. 12]OZI74430.1 cardiolipin synthase B [Bordetella genomosp. 12]
MAELSRFARCGLSCLLLLLAACASVPSPRVLQERREQAALSAGSARQSQLAGQRLAARTAGAEGASEQARFLARHLAVESAISGSPLVPGNEVKLLADGQAAYAAMLHAIERAARYVHMETYIFDEGAAGEAFVSALIAARQRGVPVAVTVDAVGTLQTPESLFDRLRAAGVQVVVFNPVNPVRSRKGWSPNQRNHRKLLVVDGEVGFLGGINVSDVYAASGSSPGGDEPGQAPWRDTHMEVRGPAVTQIEEVLLAGWQAQRGPPLDGGRFLRVVPRQGDTVLRILANDPQSQDGYAVYLTLMSAFESAQHAIHITMAYFVPDPAFVQALAQAARRGVDVVLVLPGFSDSAIVWHAGRSHYTALLQAGVKIYERRDALLHAKTTVVDGVWATVGSSNMDWRSFGLNYEINAVVLGPAFAQEMEALFERDRQASVRVDAAQWGDRPAGDRFMESFSRLFERWL